MNWAKVLWPSNTEENIINIFLLAAERARSLSLYEDVAEDILMPCYVYDITHSVLFDSWLYSVTQCWMDNKEIDPRFQIAAKKALFEIGLGQ
jgi:hypothetical protein